MRDNARAFQQGAGAGVIPKTGPFSHDVFVAGIGEVCDRGPALCEPQEVLFDRSNSGLLQHDLGQPDPVGIRDDAGLTFRRPHTPRHFTGVPIVPFQEVRGFWLVTQLLFPQYAAGAGLSGPWH